MPQSYSQKERGKNVENKKIAKTPYFIWPERG